MLLGGFCSGEGGSVNNFEEYEQCMARGAKIYRRSSGGAYLVNAVSYEQHHIRKDVGFRRVMENCFKRMRD